MVARYLGTYLGMVIGRFRQLGENDIDIYLELSEISKYSAKKYGTYIIHRVDDHYE